MNCVEFAARRFREHPDRTALWTHSGDSYSFGDLERLAGGAQRVVGEKGVGRGDAVLVLATPGPLLLGSIFGLLGAGVTVVFVEPWLPIGEVDGILRRVRPAAFLGSRLARLWALRVPAARAIPDWIPMSRVRRAARGGEAFHVAEVEPRDPGTITFSSGTTGAPKGLVRSHACLRTLFRLLGDEDSEEARSGPDLCVFPNMALLHVGTGRGSVLCPSRWSARSLRNTADVARVAAPTTLSCGPGYLRRLLAHRNRRPHDFGTLRQIAVGGAQVDCDVLERGFEHWPGARWMQVYGGSEAEPVALTDARASVMRSRERGLFQALHLGTPIPDVDTAIEEDGLWVSGPNVASRFADGGPPEGCRTDDRGREWHRMGDRIAVDHDGWWYEGRAGQARREFALEQLLYTDLGTSACFVHREPDGRLLLYGEGLPQRARRFDGGFRARYPEIDGVRPIRIVRDRRHRARIDRRASLTRGGYAHD